MLIGVAPAPGVAQPERGQQGERRRIRTTVNNADPNRDVIRGGLRVFDEDIEIATLIKDTRINQLEFRLITPTPAVLLEQALIGKTLLRILVKPPHEAMGGGIGEMVIVIFNIFAVVPLFISQTKRPLFQNGVLAIPKGKRKAKTTLVIANAQQAIFAPAINTRVRMIVGERSPGIAISRIVFTHSAPLALWQIAAPTPPRHVLTVALGYTAVF